MRDALHQRSRNERKYSNKIRRCGSTTKKGKRCRMLTRETNCFLHRKNLPESTSKLCVYSNQCSICLENIIEEEEWNRGIKFPKDNSIFVNTCGHGYHSDCIGNIRKDECPVCRKKLENLYPHLKKKIMRNIEIEEEETREENANMDELVISRDEYEELFFVMMVIQKFIMDEEGEIVES